MQTTPDIPTINAKTFVPKDYIYNLIYTGTNLEDIIDELRVNNVQHLMVGTESGVEMADLLSERLGLMTNGTAKSEARRNKFLMIEALKEDKLQTADHIKSSNLVASSYKTVKRCWNTRGNFLLLSG